MDRVLIEKYGALKDYLASFGSLAVAFSSGVDSTFLLYAAKEALNDQVIAVTSVTASLPKRELKESVDFCKEIGVAHFLAKIDVMQIPGFRENPKNRCYFCKKEIFKEIIRLADREGMAKIAEGSNLDDEGDFRPGMQAIAELGVESPLRHIGFTKAEIRSLSKELGLPTWEKPSYACLASRFPYGDPITEEKLQMVDRAEQLLLDLGFKQMRVRLHGDLARIEIEPADFERFMQEDIRMKIYEEFQKIGFSYTALDLKGFRSGSMNETLRSTEK